MRPKHPTRMGDILGSFLEKKGLSERLDLAGAVERWAAVVGPKVAAVTRAEAVSADGILWVRVISSAWAAELSLIAPQILARLNAGRDGQISELRYRIGPMGPSPVGPSPMEPSG